ncbi:MAG: flagellar assembly protein FliW [Proteobacteria bacterium]|nr:flagellar assembly protein FliW [Pseudomonadota bacterium]
MNIESPRFGTLSVEADKIIEFPAGLAAFEDCHRFTLFHPIDAEAQFFILQSVDDAAVAFHIADPALLGFSYEIKLSDEELALLKLSDPQEAAVMVILWKNDAEPDAKLRANLNAPLIININERRGLQHIFARLNYAVAPT